MMEFMDETLTKDEMAFYLQARHVLHEGPMLLKGIDKEAKIQYISIEVAKRFLQKILSKVEGEEFTKFKVAIEIEAEKDTQRLIRKYLAQDIPQKEKDELVKIGMERANIKIDAAKLLRLLLEFYR